MMKEKLKLSNKADRKKIAEYLRIGKVGLFPTDTVYGICCRMDDAKAVKRIFEIKNREKEKPFLILCESLDSIKKYAVLNLDSRKKEIIDKFWPGPLTIIFNSKPTVNKTVRANKNSIAIRIPDNNDLREVIHLTGIPIVAPSANLSGDATPSSLSEVDEKIIASVDFIVDGECRIKSPSTIINFSKEKVELIREGAIRINL